MSETNDSSAPSGSVIWKVLGVAVLAAALIGGNVYQMQQVDDLRNEVAQWRASVQAGMTELRETQSTDTAAQSKRIEQLSEQALAANRQVATATSRSRAEARKAAAELARLSEEQEQKRQQLATELTEVKEAASSANTRISDVSSEVTLVKTDVASTRSDLEKTISELHRATGDMGVMSGLIATNSKELAALRELGERNYYEFDLAKSKTAHRVGNITMLVKKADTKRNKYTVELVADDKRVEKKDRTVNEPVQFYVLRSRQPYEIVVNEVRKDRLVGYLATPKVQLARN